MNSQRNLPFLVEIEGQSKGGRDVVGLCEIPVDRLRENVKSAASNLAEVFQDICRVGSFELAELTIGLEVGAEGGIHFIGTSKVNGSASLTLKFRPPSLDN